MSNNNQTYGPAVDGCLNFIVIVGLMFMGPLGWILLCCMVADYANSDR